MKENIYILLKEDANIHGGKVGNWLFTIPMLGAVCAIQ